MSLRSKYMDDAIFKLPTALLLSKVVDSLDEIYDLMNETQNADVHGELRGDVRGDVYEYLLSKIAQSGRNGQFRTPRHIIRMMVELMDPGADEMICDPACGTSGFLVTAAEYLRETRKKEIFFDREKRDHYMNEMFTGYDMDRTMLRIGAMNMMTHGIDNPCIEYRDSLSDQNTDAEKYSLILANPPFKSEKQEADLKLLLEETIEPFEEVATQKKVTLKLHLEEGVTIRVNREQIAQLVSILTENAAKYVNDGGKIVWRLTKTQHGAVLVVKNTTEKELPDTKRMFDRFYRSDSSRSSKTGGQGIGLSIAKKIVDSHKGSITAKAGDGMVTFRVSLPK